MNRPCLLGLLLFSGRSLLADGFSIGLASIPERAGVPVAYVEKQRCKIVAYKGVNPVVILDGAAKQFKKVPISVIPGGEFGPGYVTIEHSEAVNEREHSWGSTSSGPTYAAYTAFYAKMTADRDLSDAFLILLVYEVKPDSEFTEVPRLALLGSSIGSLAAGKKTVVKADFPPLSSNMSLRWVALVFSAGSQVRTSDGNGVLDSLFDVTDHVGQSRAMARRASGDFPVEVFRRFPLRFRDEEMSKYAGQTVNATITISPKGTFDYLTIDGTGYEDLSRDLATQFSYWLFLPQVKDGQPQSTSVELPIKF